MKRGEFLMHIFEQMGYTVAKTRHFSSISFDFYIRLESGIRMHFYTNYKCAYFSFGGTIWSHRFYIDEVELRKPPLGYSLHLVQADQKSWHFKCREPMSPTTAEKIISYLQQYKTWDQELNVEF